MNVEVSFFGPLTDITGAGKLQVNGVRSTPELLTRLGEQFPALLEKQFLVAVNNRIVKDDTALPEGASVSLLPPFSGG